MHQKHKVSGINLVVGKPSKWDGSKAIILGHGAGNGMNSPFMSFFHEGLENAGFLTVKFNFPYIEKGRRAPDTQKTLRKTYSEVIDLVAAKYRPVNLVIGGKSMGGRVASYVAADSSLVSGLLFLGYPLHPPGRTDKLRDEHLYALKQSMLFISGTRDALGKKDLLTRVVNRLGRRARIFWIEGGDHSLQIGKKDSVSLGTALHEAESWLKQT